MSAEIEEQNVSSISFKEIIAAITMAMILGGLTVRAATVQGSSLLLAIPAAALGGLLGFGFSKGTISFGLLLGISGSLVGLQFFTCFPCDGNQFAMPCGFAIIGYLIGKSYVWLMSPMD